MWEKISMNRTHMYRVLHLFRTIWWMPYKFDTFRHVFIARFTHSIDIRRPGSSAAWRNGNYISTCIASMTATSTCESGTRFQKSRWKRLRDASKTTKITYFSMSHSWYRAYSIRTSIFLNDKPLPLHDWLPSRTAIWSPENGSLQNSNVSPSTIANDKKGFQNTVSVDHATQQHHYTHATRSIS